MAATRSSRLEAGERGILLHTAVAAIETRLSGADEPLPDVTALPSSLALVGSSFVSLHTAAGLRGCCGTLEPVRALALDVWRNARASAFADPRFAPLGAQEWVEVTELEISILSCFEPMHVRSEDELLHELEPGVDGLVLAWRGRRATFLPRVWDQIASPREFVARLKEKAGLDVRFWAADLELLRYRTESMTLVHPAALRRTH